LPPLQSCKFGPCYNVAEMGTATHNT